MISDLTLRSLIHFECIFVYRMRKCFNHIILHVAVQFSQQHLLKRLPFLLCIFLPPLLQINCSYNCGFISGLSILSYVSVFIPIPCYFDYYSFVVSKTGSVIPLASFFFLKIALAIQGLLWLHINFSISCSSFVENVMHNLIGIALNLQIDLGSMDFLTMLILLIQ